MTLKNVIITLVLAIVAHIIIKKLEQKGML